MIQHERLFGKSLHQLDRRRQLFRINQYVVGQFELFQAADAAQEVLAQYEVVGRFVLDDMPHAHEFPVLREFGELFLDPFRTQIDPADDAFDHGGAVGKREEPT